MKTANMPSKLTFLAWMTAATATGMYASKVGESKLPSVINHTSQSFMQADSVTLAGKNSSAKSAQDAIAYAKNAQVANYLKTKNFIINFLKKL